ncbi:MAG: L,D-transpeptidase family protein [Chloroflexi bacterium]|nr:L,D-transpeptidase family protein [Chloroflexota bacterium]
MNDPLSKLRDSMAQQNGKMPQGGGGSGNGRQANGPARGVAKSGKSKKKKSLILPILLIMVGCAVFVFAAWSAVNSPVLASILSLSSAPQEVQRAPAQSFAQVDIAKPTYTPAVLQASVAEAIQPTATFTSIPAAVDTALPEIAAPAVDVVILPTNTPFIEPAVATSVPQLASDSSVISAEIVPDTPTPEYVAVPTSVAYVPPAVTGSGGEHWIDVNLSEQRVYAYEGDTLVNSFVVSTGTWQTPTVTGKYKIWIKLRSAAMSGSGYYLPDVPFIMYFYKGYGLHGTYWHNNFGTPMSHGCVNLTIPDAEWIYNFTNVGTVVNVHY